MRRTNEKGDYQNHDDIILSLTKEKIINIFKSYFGEKGSWSSFHFIINKEIDQLTMTESSTLISKYKPINSNKTFKSIREECIKDNDIITKMSIIDSFDICTNFEFPLIKGESQYKTTKGFIDLIVHIKSNIKGNFSCYQSETCYEFLIEVKKEADFNDLGSILRQIKEYREYYLYSCDNWDTHILNENTRKDHGYGYKNSIFCLIADKIPEGCSEFFEKENIKVIDLSQIK